MSRLALVKLLITQTVLLVLALWAGAWLGRDEFLLATERREEEEIKTGPSPVADADEGVPIVRLSAGAQRQVGIEVAPAEPAELSAEQALLGVVLDAQALAELHGRLRAARHELDAARAVAAASAQEARRVQGLYDDDRNASLRALEAARAQSTADAARERAAQAALGALRDTARASWGPRVAAWLDGSEAGGPLQGLLTGREALLRVAVPADDSLPAEARLQFLPAGAKEPRPAVPLGAAPAADASAGNGGRSLLFRVAGAGLAPGQRLTLRRADGERRAGVLVPASAIVWHVGQPWIYVRESEAELQAPANAASKPAAAKDDDDDAPAASGGAAFQRRAVPHARRQGDRWFLPDFDEDDPVVVQGAQVLLSEELKYQIRDENDD